MSSYNLSMLEFANAMCAGLLVGAAAISRSELVADSAGTGPDHDWRSSGGRDAFNERCRTLRAAWEEIEDRPRASETFQELSEIAAGSKLAVRVQGWDRSPDQDLPHLHVQLDLTRPASGLGPSILEFFAGKPMRTLVLRVSPEGACSLYILRAGGAPSYADHSSELLDPENVLRCAEEGVNSARALEDHYNAWYADWLASVTEPPKTGKVYTFSSFDEAAEFVRSYIQRIQR